MFLLRNRLVHFLVLGGAIFALAPHSSSPRDIAFDSSSLAVLEQAQARRGAADVSDVRSRVVEDEILYREAIRLGLERSDTIVRQRLIQKVLFLAEDLAGVPKDPSEDELRAFFEENKEQWKGSSRVRLIHVYGRPERKEELARLRPMLSAGVEEPPAAGDAFPLSRKLSLTREEIARDYGEEFASAIESLEIGSWQGPIQSKFGWHLLKLLARDQGPPAYEEVKGELPLLYLLARKKRAVAEFVEQASKRYHPTLDGKPLGDWHATGRVAPARTEVE